MEDPFKNNVRKNRKLFAYSLYKAYNKEQVMKTDILQSITERLREVLPSGAHAILFGSRARGDVRHDSDWDVLILLDKTKIEAADYDNVSYPLVELGWSLNECISPVLYTFKDWANHYFTPFYHNVKDEGIQLV